MRGSSNYLAILVLGACVWAYMPALGGGFLFDDLVNISENPYLQIDSPSFDNLKQASFSSHSGPLRRPVAMLSFTLNYLATGLDPWWMKLTNMLIHVANGCLLWLILGTLLSKTRLKFTAAPGLMATLVAGAWLLHPINLTAVAYIVQRMTSLSATFVLLAIYFYMQLRICGWKTVKTPVLGLLVMLCWALGMLSKEVGIVLSLYVFLLEYYAFGFHTTEKREKLHLTGILSVLAAPWLIALVYTLYKPSFIFGGFEDQYFSPLERQFTEFRVVMDYLLLIILPDSTRMGVYQDNVVLSHSLFSPASTFISLLAIVGFLGLAIKFRRALPLFSFGILWFFCGHVLESTVYPLELKFLHRNYLPSIGLLLALASVLHFVLKRYRYLLVPTALVFLLGFAVTTRSLSYFWSGDTRMQLLEAINNPDSIRANFRAGQILKAYAVSAETEAEKGRYREMATGYFNNIEKIESGNATGTMAIVQTYLQTGRAPPGVILEKLHSELKTSRFNVAMLGMFTSFKDCLLTGSCKLGPKNFEKMMSSISQNDNVLGYYKRTVLVDYAIYLAEYIGDTNAAIIVLLEALNVYSIKDDLRLLSSYYERTGNFADMASTLDLLEENDRFGVFKSYISSARKRLDAEN